MSTVTSLVSNVVNWDFLNEPLYRWAIFVLALSFITAGWNGILEFMR